MAKNAFADMSDLLGAGVDALFANTGMQYSLVYLDQIEIHVQIRESFEDDENTLADLAASIQARGVLQPILLRPTATGYALIAGERRYRASKIAGLEQIPAYIREMSDEEAEDAQLAENIHRKNLTQIEEAKKIQRDLDKLGSIDAVLAKHQKSRAWLSKMLALLRLPEQAKRLVTENVSADVEVINTVRTIEKADPKAAKALVDDLKKTRGKENAREKAATIKEKVKPSKSSKKAPSKPALDNTAGAKAKITDETGEDNHGGFEQAPTLPSSDSASVTDTLRQAYGNIVEFGAAPQMVLSALTDKARDSTESWLRDFYEAGVQAKDVGRAVIRGFRAGQFASEGEGAFALIAFLQGADSDAKFNFLNILGGVKD